MLSLKKAIVIVGVVVVAALVMVLFLPGLQSAIDSALNPDAGMAANLDVAFYDEDGTQVGSIAFVRTGSRVESITVTLSYTVTSSSEQFVDDLAVMGEVVIEWATGSPGAEYQVADEHVIMTAMMATNSYAWDHNLYDIITVDATGKYYGWGVRITAELQAQTTMEDGEVVTSDPWTEVASFSLSWESDSLVITGSVGG